MPAADPSPLDPSPLRDPRDTGAAWRVPVLLMLAPFAFGTGAFVFAGLLDPMAQDLGVSVAAVGQLQTAFALACAVGGPVLAVATRAAPRKALLLAVLAVLLLGNAAAALAPGFEFLVIVRIATGFIGALTLPLASTIAIQSTPDAFRPRALALVFSGTALSFLLGIPIGTALGAAFGWAVSFWFAAGLSALAGVVIHAFVPATAAPPAPPKGAFAQVLQRPITGYFGLTFLSFAATFASVAYIGPLVTALTGLTGTGIGLLQILVGLGSLVGLALGAALASRKGAAALFGLLGVIAVTQAAFSADLLVEMSGPVGLVTTALALTIGAAALFATTPIVQAQLAARAGPNATVAFALNGAMIFLGQGAGAGLGGVVFAESGPLYLGLAGAVVAVLGMVAALRLRRA